MRRAEVNLLAMGALGLVVSLAVGCDRARDAAAMESPPQEAARAVDPAPVLPSVMAEVGQPLSKTLELQSHLMVERDVGVTVRRDGIVEEIHVDRGARVRENDVLAVLERGDLLVSERAALVEFRTEQAAYERARRLLDQAIISDEEFEQSELRFHAAEESLERIRYDLSKCFIRAPFDGVVTGRFVEKGQFLREDDRAPVFQVTALGPLLARVYVPEGAVIGLRVGQEALIRPEVASPSAGREAPIPARIKWINHVVDAASASAEVLVEVTEDGARGLRPGLSVSVVLTASFPGGSVTLPVEALGGSRPGTGATLALRVIGDDGEVHERPVVIGTVGDSRVEIRGGLQPGEKVLVDVPPE